MKRQHQVVLILSTLAGCWLAMQAVHELGHAIGAVLSGGQIERVVLHPLRLSQTQLSENPHPLFVAWSGPIVGIALPGLGTLVARRRKLRFAFLWQFFASFCLVANGAYLGVGSFQEIGDAGDMLHHGTPIWLLWLFGFITVPAGLWLWNDLGPSFGLGVARGHVDRTAAQLVFCLLVATIALELAFA